MSNLKKAAVICAVVMMISIIPVFALNDTSNNTTKQTPEQNIQQQNGHGNWGNCDGTCDGNQHKYGKSKGNMRIKNCKGQNGCSNCANKN